MKSPKVPCGICCKNVNANQKNLLCNKCNSKVHIKCNDISVLEYEKLLNDQSNGVSWFCKNCIIDDRALMFPFGAVDNEVLSNLFDIDIPSFVDSVPSFEVTSQLTNLPSLQDYDVDEHLSSAINSNYHTIQDLSNSNISRKDFSLLHMNIRSLSCHFDDLHSLLVNLNVKFDVVGVSETWDSIKNPVSTNVNISGYSFFSTKSKSQNGGVGLYIKTGLGPVPRPDLNASTDHYETVWVEIENTKDKNILICCAYRHPSYDPEIFTDYMQDLLSNSSVTNKQVYILGDFNIDLLNYDSHISTGNFVILFLSQHFLPYIVHPTRVSDQSATIIDNIFSNACNFDTISGNILTQISDHFPQFIIVKKAGITARSLSYYQHDYATFNQENFICDFNATSLEYLNDSTLDVNDKFN